MVEEEVVDAAGVSFDELPLERLEAELTGLAGHLAAGECRFLSLLAAYDRREGWREWGCRSCAYWLSWKCGIDLRTAHEKLRVAHALEAFPRIRAAFAAGRLSYSKARALTRMAGPDTEADLVEMALRATAAHIESNRAWLRPRRAFRGTPRGQRRRCGSSASAARRSPRRRRSRARHPGRVVDPRRDPNRDAGPRRRRCGPVSCRRVGVDGRELLGPRTRLSARRGPHPGDDHRRQRLLAGDDTGTARFLDGPAILPETARRLCCDASFVWLLRGEHGEPVNVSSRHALPRALRRMVRARDQGRCRFPGCGETLDLGWAVTSLYYSNHREQWARHLEQAAGLRARAHPGST